MAVNPSETWQEALERWIDASSQKRVAKHLGYSQSAISQIRKGKYAGDCEYIQELIEQRLVGKECTLQSPLGSGHRHRKERQQDAPQPQPWNRLKKSSSPSQYDGEAQDQPTVEKHVQALLQQREGGDIEVRCAAGYVDLLTHGEVIEIKNSKSWKDATKVLVYAQYFPGRKPRIHLFDNHLLDYDTHRTIVQSCIDLGIRVTWEDAFYYFTELYEPS